MKYEPRERVPVTFGTIAYAFTQRLELCPTDDKPNSIA
jgi:hypothetical protein